MTSVITPATTPSMTHLITPTPMLPLTPALATSPLRAAISAATRLPEPRLLPALLAQAQPSPNTV